MKSYRSGWRHRRANGCLECDLAYYVLDFVEELDPSAIERELQRKDVRGKRVFSSRKLERATYDDVAFRVPAAGEHPHFTTINELRARHRAAFAELFHPVLEVCMSAGLVKRGHVAFDGTRMKANASKHKAMSYDRMKTDEARLETEVEALLQRAEQTDAAEDAQYGVGKQPADLPAEIARREGRRANIREALAALEPETARARAAEHVAMADELRAAASTMKAPRQQAEMFTRADQHDQQAADLDDDDPPPPAVDSDLRRNTPPEARSGAPKPKAQRNFTDPDSRIMFRDGTYVQAYNAQIAVDEGHQIIVAGAEHLEPVLRRVVDNCDCAPDLVAADAGYFSTENVRAAEQLGSEPFFAVGRHRNDGLPDDAFMAPSLDSDDRQRMRALLETERGRAVHARRKVTALPVFGQQESARGIRRRSFRGIWKDRCEGRLICATHNLLELWRALRSSDRRQRAAVGWPAVPQGTPDHLAHPPTGYERKALAS